MIMTRSLENDEDIHVTYSTSAITNDTIDMYIFHDANIRKNEQKKVNYYFFSLLHVKNVERMKRINRISLFL